jgi:hypothetical protein
MSGRRPASYWFKTQKTSTVQQPMLSGFAEETREDIPVINDLTILEIKGWETEQDQAKHQAAQRWVTAVNNWGKLGRWAFHINHDQQMLGQELKSILTLSKP